MKTTRTKLLLLLVAFGNVAAVARGAGLGPEDATSVSWFTGCAAVVFTVGIVLVFALEVAADRRARRQMKLRVVPEPKPVRPLFVIEDDDGRTRVFKRTTQSELPNLGYLSSGLMNLKVSPATKPPNTSATR